MFKNFAEFYLWRILGVLDLAAITAHQIFAATDKGSIISTLRTCLGPRNYEAASKAYLCTSFKITCSEAQSCTTALYLKLNHYNV